jgi:hypothetical protein
MTAVEWLVDEWINLDSMFELNYIDKKTFWIKLNELQVKAKEMEKEQIIESYCQGCFDIIEDECIFPRETAEEYYNETFKNTNK